MMLMQETVQIDPQPESKAGNGGRKLNLLGLGLALLLATGAFFSGLQIGTGSSSQAKLEAGLFSLLASAPSQPEDTDMTEFWRVWEILENKFAFSSSTDQLSSEDRLRGAIAGLVASYGDPYTIYFPPQDANQFQQDISGNFGGVGMEVGIRDGVVTIITPLPGTPAEGAGLISGDVIVAIDGETTERMGIDDAVRRIRGEVGTEVVLTIYREGELDFLEIPVERDNISIPTIATEERDGIFVISLFNFNAISEMKMQEALREYVTSGDRKLVLDLRGNPGGFLQSAVSIASYFLPTGKVVVKEGLADGADGEVYRSSGKTLLKFAPEEMVVLINGGSASAAEILAGALAEHDVATLMGDTSFGKGSVQELVDLPEGSSVKVTIARWFTPNGISISNGGLDPDIFIKRTPQQIMNNVDPQLDAAIAWLNGDKELLEYVGTSTAVVAEEAEAVTE